MTFHAIILPRSVSPFKRILILSYDTPISYLKSGRAILVAELIMNDSL